MDIHGRKETLNSRVELFELANYRVWQSNGFFCRIVENIHLTLLLIADQLQSAARWQFDNFDADFDQVFMGTVDSEQSSSSIRLFFWFPLKMLGNGIFFRQQNPSGAHPETPKSFCSFSKLFVVFWQNNFWTFQGTFPQNGLTEDVRSPDNFFWYFCKFWITSVSDWILHVSGLRGSRFWIQFGTLWVIRV